MMKRGEIYFADLNPTVGAEINKKRPVLIISNDANNKAASTVTILPITSNVAKIYPFEVGLASGAASLPKASKIQCQQIRTISKTRILKRVGCVDNLVLEQVDVALKLHLEME